MKNRFISGGWIGVFATSVVISLAGCGSPDKTAAPARSVEESPQPGPPPEAPIQVGDVHVRREYDELEKLKAVEWVVQAGDKAYIGVVAAAYRNDANPVLEACMRVQLSKDVPMMMYIVDDAIADPGWKPGDDGQIEKVKLPLELNFK